jgi:MFS family permease
MFVFLKPMKERNFLLLLLNTAFWAFNMTTGRILLSWLVLDTTNSPALLGVNLAARFAPMILGAVLGTVVDRISRRKLLFLTQAMYIVTDLGLGFLVLSGRLEFWHTVIASLIYGFGVTLGMPARNVLTTDIVETSSLSDANALMNIAMTGMGFLGPTVVAILINRVGISTFYFLMVAVYVFGLITLHVIHVTEVISPVHQSAWKNLVEGLQYHRSRRDIASLQLIALIANMFIFPMVPDLLVPIMAKDVLGVGASGYGWLSSAQSLGNLTGSLCILMLGRYGRKGLLTVVDALLWGPVLWVFATSTVYSLSLSTMFAFGVMTIISMTFIDVLLLINSPSNMRGRVMGVRMQVITCEFLGNLIWGPALSVINPATAGQINSILFTLSMIGIILWAPSLREME